MSTSQLHHTEETRSTDKCEEAAVQLSSSLSSSSLLPPLASQDLSVVNTTAMTADISSYNKSDLSIASPQKQQHIRPTKLKRFSTTTTSTPVPPPSPPSTITTTTTTTTTSSIVPGSILRKSPKYTTKLSSIPIKTVTLDTTMTTTPQMSTAHNNESFDQQNKIASLSISSPPVTLSSPSSSSSSAATAVQEVLPKIQYDHVVERPRDSSRRRRFPKQQQSYDPITSNGNNNNNNNNNNDTTTTTEALVALIDEDKINGGGVEGYLPKTGGGPVRVVSSTTANVNVETKPLPSSLSTTTTTTNLDDKNDDCKVDDTDDDDDDDDDTSPPLIFNSLSDLLAMAGTLPSSDDDPSNNTTTMIETQLDFSVIDPTDFQQQQQEIFYGITSVPPPPPPSSSSSDYVEQHEADFTLPSDEDITDPIHVVVHDDEQDQERSDPPRKSIRERFSKAKNSNDNDEYSYTTEESNILNSDDDNDDSDDDILMDALKHHSIRETVTPPPPPRAFIVIWNALSQWVTPTAVEWIVHLRNDTTTNHNVMELSSSSLQHKFTYRQTNDIALSRCHGLINMIQLQTSRCWTEYMNINGRYKNNLLRHSNNEKDNNTTMTASSSVLLLRYAEQSIATLLRCLDYTYPTPKFNMIQIRALTCILLDMVLVGSDNKNNDTPSLPKDNNIDSATATTTTIRNNETTIRLQVPIPCSTLGMTYEEYHYLVQSSILSFQTDLMI